MPYLSEESPVFESSASKKEGQESRVLELPKNKPPSNITPGAVRALAGGFEQKISASGLSDFPAARSSRQ